MTTDASDPPPDPGDTPAADGPALAEVVGSGKPGSRVVDVSVIMPAYKAAATIKASLESIIGQTVLPAEVLVILDGPDEETVQVCEELRERFGRTFLHIIEQPHAGAGAARNRGLAEARGEYVAFLDADDLWYPRKLEVSFDTMTSEDLVILAHDIMVRTRFTRYHLTCHERFKASNDPYAMLYRKGYISTASVVARRDALLEAGGFDPSLRTAQDFDLWLRVVARHETRFDVLDQPLAEYYAHSDGITSNTERRLACCLRIAKGYYFTLQGRAGSAFGHFLYRVTAIHKEAFDVHLARRAYWSALAIGPRYLATISRSSLSLLFNGRP